MSQPYTGAPGTRIVSAAPVPRPRSVVLVVDDDPPSLAILAYRVEKLGMRALTAENGVRGMEVLRARGGAVDLIIVDENMPWMDGYEMCRQVRLISSVPILFLTSDPVGYDRVAARARAAGANEIVTRPIINAAEFHALIRRLAYSPHS